MRSVEYGSLFWGVNRHYASPPAFRPGTLEDNAIAAVGIAGLEGVIAKDDTG